MAQRTLPNVGLVGFWDLGYDGWKDEMDANLLWLSVLTQGRFSDQVADLPGSPSAGDIVVLAAAHGTHPNEIAVYDGGTWKYKVPLVGWRLYNVTLGIYQSYNGTIWAADSSGLTAEDVRDVIGAALVSGTNVTITPNDGSDTITIDAAGGLTAEGVMDTIAAMLTQGTNVTLTYNDVADTLTVAASGGGGASTTQTGEQISGFIATPLNKSYTVALKMAHAGTITEVTTKSASGTCTATWKINSTALGGTANSVSSSEVTQAHSSANAFVAGDDVVLTISSNSSCADMSFTIKYTRTLS